METLAHYRIVSLLGKGGMGEVFLAEDTRLHRKVALKVRLPEVAEDTEKLARFVQEARAASALSHPNAAHIYEIGEANGRHFLAMEYIEGQTLEKKLSGEPLPLAEIVATPLYIDDQPGQTATAIEAKAARLQATAGLSLVVVDYLGLMAAERKGMENREQVVAAISRAMKGLAKRLNVPVILLSQLNRELYKRVDKRPILSDLRESGSIEQDADLVLFLHREEYYNRDDPSLAGKG